MEQIERTVRAADGRTLLVEEGGDPHGRPILVLAGTPNSRHLFGAHLALAASQGIRLIGYDRPGYGGSTPMPGRNIADAASDVRTIADALKIDRLALWGISGGGPHALACAALLEGRAVAVASLASPAPYGAPGLDFFRGMGELNAKDFQLLLNDPEAARKKTLADREAMLAATPEGIREYMKSLLSPVDAAVFTGAFAEHLARNTKAGLAPGIQGWWDDGCAGVKAWGFELDSIRVPLMLWHGRHDRFVPFSHGEWLAGAIPNVEAHLSDDDGHLTLTLRRLPAIHAWLLGHF
ncbi:MAG: alpha/beta hydrolase [Candidatus Dormibacteraeota bacterium]|nr:alpha/beta hydrolase [Candidatus Dormibacteraeota bacterium]